MKRRARRRIADLIGFAVGLVVVTTVAVAASRADDLRAPDAEAIYQVELASYDKAVAKWLRDSAVIDSISRAIDTDSLYGLYRQMLDAPDAAVAAQAVACEEWRLARLYQPLPATAAVRRMRDTVWRAGDSSALRLLTQRLPELGHVQVGHWSCGYPGEVRTPPEVDGASLTNASRPNPPRRP